MAQQYNLPGGGTVTTADMKRDYGILANPNTSAAQKWNIQNRYKGINFGLPNAMQAAQQQGTAGAPTTPPGQTTNPNLMDKGPPNLQQQILAQMLTKQGYDPQQTMTLDRFVKKDQDIVGGDIKTLNATVQAYLQATPGATKQDAMKYLLGQYTTQATAKKQADKTKGADPSVLPTPAAAAKDAAGQATAATGAPLAGMTPQQYQWYLGQVSAAQQQANDYVAMQQQRHDAEYNQYTEAEKRVADDYLEELHQWAAGIPSDMAAQATQLAGAYAQKYGGTSGSGVAGFGGLTPAQLAGGSTSTTGG